MFALAEKLGMTVAQIGREVSAYELTEWAAFFEIREKARKRQELQDKAEAGVAARRGRRGV